MKRWLRTQTNKIRYACLWLIGALLTMALARQAFPVGAIKLMLKLADFIENETVMRPPAFVPWRRWQQGVFGPHVDLVTDRFKNRFHTDEENAATYRVIERMRKHDDSSSLNADGSPRFDAQLEYGLKPVDGYARKPDATADAGE